MGDLISREQAIFFVSDVLDIFGVNVGDKMANALIDSLKSQPTAFDLEDVMQQFKERVNYAEQKAAQYDESDDLIMADMWYRDVRAYKNSIAILNSANRHE